LALHACWPQSFPLSEFDPVIADTFRTKHGTEGLRITDFECRLLITEAQEIRKIMPERRLVGRKTKARHVVQGRRCLSPRIQEQAHEGTGEPCGQHSRLPVILFADERSTSKITIRDQQCVSHQFQCIRH
jgi:hypothetical protein